MIEQLLEKKTFWGVKKNTLEKMRLHIEYQYSLFHFIQSMTLYNCNSYTNAYKHYQAWSHKTIQYNS